MAKNWKGFVDALRGRDGRGQVQGFLRPIDVEDLADELKLDEEAFARGKQELPPSENTSLDSNEGRIVQRLESEWQWHGAELVNNLKAFSSRLLAVSVHTEFARLDLAAQNALSRLQSASHRAESELGPLREAYVTARDELNDFKTEHRLKRAARSPSSRQVTIGLLIILISVEAAANSVFFEKGSELGWLGGLWTAVCISAVNVVVAFSIGLFPMRWTRHRNFLIAFFGYVVSFTGLCALISIHAIAAHLREVTAVVGEEAALLAAVDSLKTNPFGLKDLNSYYLFVIGVVWAIVAARKGFTFDDPYPGYGAHFRRAEAARRTYSDEHDNLFEDLEDIKEETVREIDNGIARIPLFPLQAAQIRAEREALRQNFKGYEAAINTAANQLLSRYRDKNRIARSTPAPKHFDTAWQLPHTYLNEVTVQAELAEPPSQQMDPNQALEKLRVMSSAVLNEYNSLMSSYPHPTKIE